MKKLFNQKRGFVADIILYLVFIFILGLILVVIWYAVKSYNTAWQSTPNIPTESKSIMSDFSNRFTNVWDFFYLFLVVGFGLVVIILGFAVRSHPVFAILTMLFIVILGIVGVYFANSYDDVITSSPGLTDAANDFSFITYFEQKLPYLVLIFGTIFIIILYSKNQQQAITI